MGELNEINKSKVDLTGESFVSKACQTSTQFLSVLRSDYGTTKLEQILKTILEKFEEEACGKLALVDCDDLKDVDHFKQLLLGKGTFYKKFAEFCFDKQLILEDENDPNTVSKEIILGVAKILSSSGESYDSLRSKESAFELDRDELRKELNKFNVNDDSKFLDKLFSSFSNINELDHLFEKKHLKSVFKDFFRFPSDLSDQEIKNKEQSRLMFLEYLSSIENGKLWLSLLIKSDIFRYFSENPLEDFKKVEKIDELSETDNGQFLLATMVNCAIIRKSDISKAIRQKFHPELKADVLTFWDRF